MSEEYLQLVVIIYSRLVDIYDTLLLNIEDERTPQEIQFLKNEINLLKGLLNR